MIKIALMTIIYSVGYALKSDGKQALEEIFTGMKSKLGIRGSIFNYVLELDTLEIRVLKAVGIENDIIINQDLLRAT